LQQFNSIICINATWNDNVKRSSEEQLADIAHEFVRQNKLKRRWRILLSLLFFGYIFSVSYVSLRESGILQDANFVAQTHAQYQLIAPHYYA
jgi:hypothetical protein